ncbi:hypothetical protein L4D13_06400 [Photobacterium profundum]|uniref:hypothetical protein n=1 Tax=Photobacterium profundum TaxID=74109 RepID=UPI003D0A09A5
MRKKIFPDWFCLIDGRNNFQIEPYRDREFLFGNSEWRDKIEHYLYKADLLSMALRLIFWGQYGIGKTHLLRYLQYIIENSDYPYETYYLHASDIQDKTGFEHLLYEMVTVLGFDSMRNMLRNYQLKYPLDDGQSEYKFCQDNPDVNKAFSTLVHPSEKPALAAWNYLSGRKLENIKEQEIAGVSKRLLEKASDFAAVIQVFANIIEEMTGRQLLYLVDECENFTRITNRTLEARWNESLRALLDIQNLGIVMTVGAEKTDNIPVLILRPDIVRRIHRAHYIQMNAFKPADTEVFLKGLLKMWVDDDKRSALEASEKFDEEIEGYDPSLYPFTVKGFKYFCSTVAVDPRNAKPSEILAKLNSAAGESFDKHRLISQELLSSIDLS